MYAIVDIAGQQYKVQKDQKVYVHRLTGEEGSQVDFDKVLLIDNDSNVIVGAPLIDGAMISAKIITHLRGDKVIVFKKKRRKGYQKRNGHRQDLTQIIVEDIIETGAKPRVAEKKKKKSAPKAEKSEAVAAEPKQKTSTAAKKETASKKPAVKKETSKKPAAIKSKPAAKTAAKPAAAKSKPAAKTAAAKSKPAKTAARPSKSKPAATKTKTTKKDENKSK